MSKPAVDLIQRQIDFLIHTIKNYIPETFTAAQEEEKNITQLMIRGFNGIIATCKEELEDADEEHLKFILKTMCRVDVDGLDANGLYHSIDGFISHYIDAATEREENYFELSEKNLITMIQLKQYADDMLKSLSLHIKQIEKSRWKRWKNRTELHNSRHYYDELKSLFEALNTRIEMDADKMIERIVENFYMIFIFLLSLAKLAQFRHKTVDYIVVLSEIDRILYVIDPSLQGNTLKNKYLLYYHVVFELKEFRHSLLKII
ncbi:MAG: hypothetical protein PHW64_02630 [Sulfuricurvum sp.]|nr:hypothetical protein [Sulfuricurvum sp.]